MFKYLFLSLALAQVGHASNKTPYIPHVNDYLFLTKKNLEQQQKIHEENYFLNTEIFSNTYTTEERNNAVKKITENDQALNLLKNHAYDINIFYKALFGTIQEDLEVFGSLKPYLNPNIPNLFFEINQDHGNIVVPVEFNTKNKS